MKAAAGGADKYYDRERSGLPERRVGAIRVYGSTAFQNHVVQALLMLQNSHQYGYSLAQRYIPAIVESNADPRKGISNGVVYHPGAGGGASGSKPDLLAAGLVRRAVATRKLLGFHIAKSERSEIGSIKQQLRAMRLLGCEPKYIHQYNNKTLVLERKLRGK